MLCICPGWVSATWSCNFNCCGQNKVGQLSESVWQHFEKNLGSVLKNILQHLKKVGNILENWATFWNRWAILWKFGEHFEKLGNIMKNWAILWKIGELFEKLGNILKILGNDWKNWATFW
jgi:hypothetical protein